MCFFLGDQKTNLKKGWLSDKKSASVHYLFGSLHISLQKIEDGGIPLDFAYTSFVDGFSKV